MQFLLIAYDGTDVEAPARRQAARPAHLVRARAGRAAGTVLEGGAILNNAGQMIGSAMIFEFSSEEEFRAYLDEDPYVTGGVWQTMEIKPYRRAQMQ